MQRPPEAKRSELTPNDEQIKSPPTERDADREKEAIEPANNEQGESPMVQSPVGRVIATKDPNEIVSANSAVIDRASNAVVLTEQSRAIGKCIE